MERTRIFTALNGVRGRKPLDLAALARMLVQFSRLVVEQRWVAEIDINPLLASPEQLLALDARVVLHPPGTTEEQLPRPAIRPYPLRYVGPWTLTDGTPVTIRPIRPEDEPLIVDFHEDVSEDSVYLRYFHAMKLSQRISHERLTRICFIDYDREMALVAEGRRADGRTAILGVGRLSKKRGRNEAEFATLIADKYQGRGLGSELLARLIRVGRDEKLDRITAEILTQNLPMQKLCSRLGFRLVPSDEAGVVRAEMDLA